MKKIIVIISLIFICSACGSSKGHCDAYGNKSGQLINDEYIQQNS